jgi:ankyrin repeat protein
MSKTQMNLLNNTPIEISQISEGQPPEILNSNKKVFEVFLGRPMISFEAAFREYCRYTNVKSTDKEHPFVKAIRENNTTVIDAFLAHKNSGFDIDCIDYLRRTTAHAIAASGNIDLFNKFKKLLDWTGKDTFGNCPIHIAAIENNSKLVIALAKLGIDLDARNAAHITASQMAEEEGHKSVYDTLIENGATEIFD